MLEVSLDRGILALRVQCAPLHALGHLLLESLIAQWLELEAGNGQSFGQVPIEKQVAECRHELASGQVTARAKDDQRGSFRIEVVPHIFHHI